MPLLLPRTECDRHARVAYRVQLLRQCRDEFGYAIKRSARLLAAVDKTRVRPDSRREMIAAEVDWLAESAKRNGGGYLPLLDQDRLIRELEEMVDSSRSAIDLETRIWLSFADFPEAIDRQIRTARQQLN